jgi:uncharacterized protein (TIGR02147 family)
MINLFENRDYKTYLVKQLEKRGERNRLATALRCHNGYISQVLKGSAHFSLEQAEIVNEFLGHTKDQANYFLLMVQYARSGTKSLREHFSEQMSALGEKQFVLKDRLRYQKVLSREDQVTYFSSWHYGAVHVLVSVPGCHTASGISEYLGLPLEKVREILGFLESLALVKSEGKRYGIGPTSIHLEKDSSMIAKHHTNWRLKAIQSLDSQNREDLHYSSVITASVDDSVKIREVMVRAIEEIRRLVRESPNEASYSYALDFFSMKNAK